MELELQQSCNNIDGACLRMGEMEALIDFVGTVELLKRNTPKVE